MRLSIQSIVSEIQSKDTKERLTGVSNLELFLKTDHENQYNEESENGFDKDLIFESIVKLLTDKNHKIYQRALSCLDLTIERCGKGACKEIELMLGMIIEKLGDVKDSVREQSQLVLQTILLHCFTPSHLYELITRQQCFNHKNFRIRQQVLLTFIAAIRNFGANSVPLHSFLQAAITLLEDTNGDVREAALLAIQEVYREAGVAVKDTLKAKNLRPSLLNVVFERLSVIQPKEQPVPLHDATSSTSSSSSTAASRVIRRAHSSPQVQTHKRAESRVSSLHSVFQPSTKPIVLNSEKELIKEMEDITTVLMNHDNWKDRMQCLGKLQGFVAGNGTQYPAFLSILHKLKSQLITQLLDLRSAIVREACTTLSILSVQLGDSFESFAEAMLSTLFKCVINSTAVISESANNCIRCILQHTRCDKLIPQIAKHANATHNALRIRCIEYVLLILSESTTQQLEKHADVFEEIVSTSLTDALPEVRATSRQCFAVFNRHWTHRGDKVFNALEPSVQKYLYEEYNREEKKLRDLDSRAARIKNENKPPQGLEPHLHHTFPTTKKTNSKSEATSATRALKTMSMPLRVINNDSKPVDTQPKAKATPNSAQRVRIESKDTTTATATVQKARRVTATPTSSIHNEQPSSSSTSSISKPKRAIINNAHNNNAPTSKRVLESSAATASTKRDTNSKQRVVKPSTTQLSVKDRTAVVTAADLQRGTTENEVHRILEKSKSSLWSARVECFHELQLIISSGNSTEVIQSTFGKICSTCLHQLLDTHYKVVQQVLVCIASLLSMHPKQMERHLDKLFPDMFKKISDSKEAISKLSQSILDLILDTCQPETLLPVLLRTLDQPNVSTKIGCIQYLTRVLACCNQSHNDQLRPVLQRVALLAMDKNQTLRSSALELIGRLYNIYSREEFEAHLEPLPIDLYVYISRMLNHLPVSQTNDNQPSFASILDELDEEIAEEMELPSTNSFYDMHNNSHQSDLETLNNNYFNESNVETSFETAERLIQGEVLQHKLSPVTSPKHTLRSVNGIEDWLATLPNVFNKTSTATAKKDALHYIIQLSRDNSSIWSKYFSTIMLNVLNLLTEEREPSVCELAIISIREMLVNQSNSLFNNFIEPIIVCLVRNSIDDSREVCKAAEDTVDQLLSSCDSQKCLEVIVSVINEERSTALRTATRILTKLISKISPQTLLRQLSIILPGLFEAFKHPNADVRKSVVFCLVDMYFILGEDFTPYLAQLTATQSKLVQVYCTKRRIQGNEENFDSNVWNKQSA